MRRLSRCAFVASCFVVMLGGAPPAYGTPVLLAQFGSSNGYAGWGTSIPVPPPASIYFFATWMASPPLATFEQIAFGNNVQWYDGDSGYHDFMPGSSSKFDAWVAKITDASDNWVGSGEGMLGHGSMGGASRESVAGIYPDLIGARIDYVRLLVNGMNIQVTDNWVRATWENYTFEIWGVPEPSTAVLLASALLGLVAAMRRSSFR